MDDFLTYVTKIQLFFKLISICKPKQGSVTSYHNESWTWADHILKLSYPPFWCHVYDPEVHEKNSLIEFLYNVHVYILTTDETICDQRNVLKHK